MPNPTSIRPSPADPATTPEPFGPTSRLLSVDALRGFDMFWILGGDDLVFALASLSGGNILQGLANQLRHKEWAGIAFYDLIFPLFVFIVGVSLVFSLTKTLQQHGLSGAYKRIFRRSILLYVIALLDSGGVAMGWSEIRWLGVLNRIALCYLAGALIFCHFKWKGIAVITALLLAGYWALLSFVPFPDVRPVTAPGELVQRELTATNVAQLNFASTNRLRGVFDPGLNLANYVDQKYLPGRKWDKTWDLWEVM